MAEYNVKTYEKEIKLLNQQIADLKSAENKLNDEKNLLVEALIKDLLKRLNELTFNA